MEIRNLVTFLKVTELQNFSKAAEALDYSQSTANNLMKLYQEYGDNQESFFGSLQNSQVFGKLSYTQALALLVLPKEDREAFAEEHDRETMSGGRQGIK